MYQSLLTRRYLTSKVMPLLAALAVMLCCAMELIVWSVMGGFLVMLMESGRSLMGDVEISHDNTGISYYQDLIERLEKDPLVEAAAPTIETFGLLSLPYASGPKSVMVRGIDGASFDRVTGYGESIWWKPIPRPLPKDKRVGDPRVPYHGYAARVSAAARAVLDLPPSGLAAALRAEPESVERVREAARRFLRVGGLDREVTEEWIGQLREAGWTLARAAEKVLAAAPDTEPEPPAVERMGDLARAAAQFEAAEATYRQLREYERQARAVTTEGSPAMVIGTEVGGYNERHPEGFLTQSVVQLPGNTATLSVVPMDTRGRVMLTEQKPKTLPIANQMRSGLYEIDANTVLVRIDVLQRLLMLDESQRVAPGSGRGGVTADGSGAERFDEPVPTVREPARVTNIVIRAAPGTSAETLQERVREIYDAFAIDHAKDAAAPPGLGSPSLRILTWKDRNRTLISAVEKETGLVMFIFGIISLTSVFLVLAIFWAMVSEKTRDIGVLRAIGASRSGVAWLWVRYGLAIGIIGATLGGAAAYLIVLNINPIHEWLGAALGISIWDPRVYYFTTIPSTVETWRAGVVLASGIVASVIGALIPAIKAANMDPVRALRWE